MIPTARSSLAACGIVILMTALNTSAAEPALTELLKPLNLSDYSSTMRPPDFSGLTAEGKKTSLAGLRGRVVLLNFWATWCLECRPEMPLFEQLHREFTAQGLSVIGVNAREGRVAVSEYANELGLTFPLVLDSKGQISAAYGVIGLPTHVPYRPRWTCSSAGGGIKGMGKRAGSCAH
jgi:peroxiredoxin